MGHPLSAEDRLDIHELLSRYGHLIDDQDWAGAASLFTASCTYDMVDFGLGTATSPAEIVAMWTGPDAAHPAAHHATNVVISVADQEVRVRSKGMGVGHGGRVGSVTYADIVTKTDDGWRFAARTGILRRTD